MSLLAGQTLSVTQAPYGGFFNYAANPHVVIRNASGAILCSASSLTTTYYSPTDQTVFISFADGNYAYRLTVDVTINLDAPSISPLEDVITTEDLAITGIGFTFGDNQTSPEDLTLTVHSSNQALVRDENLVITGTEADRFLSITPNPDVAGTVWITVGVSDGQYFVLESFVLIVTPVNDAPTAHGLTLEAIEDVARSITLIGADADGDSLVYTVIDGPSHGRMDVTGNTVMYIPDLDYHGPDQFTYRVSDGQADSETVAVVLTVAPANDLPRITGPSSLTTLEDTAFTGTVVADDVEGDPVTFALDVGPTHGTVVVELDGSFVYDPDDDYSGPDSFMVKAGDSGGWGIPALVTVVVDSAPDAPMATPQTVLTVEDIAVGITLTGTDADGTIPTVFKIVGMPLRGRLFEGVGTDGREITGDDVVTGFTLAGDQLTYLPDADFQSDDGFAFVANDGEEDGPADFVTIVIVAANDAPVASDLALATLENLAVIGAIPVTDAEADTVTFTLVVGVAHGRLELNSDGSFLYTPEAGYAGSDTFQVAVADATSVGNQVTVTLDVQSVNQAPEASPDWYTVNRNGVLIVGGPGVLGNDTDPEGLSLSARLARGPAHGTLTLNLDGSFTYRPLAGYAGPDSFAYRANDGVLDAAPTVVAVYVILSDIQVLSAVARDGGLIELTYDISVADKPVPRFDLGFYRSGDARYGNGDDVAAPEHRSPHR
ncbi:MAG: Ig-like domain-containing protein [Gemmataceae bacterium]